MSFVDFMDKYMMWALPIAMLFMIYLFLIMPIMSSYSLDRWCIEQGFDDGSYEAFDWGERSCIKIENNTIIKTEVDYCKKTWCFVELNDALTEKGEVVE